MSNSPLAIGIDFGGTSVKCGVVDGAEVIELATRLTTKDYPDAAGLIHASDFR